jgi:hypothetical protein
MMCETERMLSEHECHSTPKLTIIIVDPPRIVVDTKY